MKEHIQDILVGGRPMTKLELANKEIERLEKENERYRIAMNEMAINICKAIEYIKTHRYPTMYGFSKNDLDKNDLINILQGSDNNE